jgi:hypothetical protein
VAGDGGQRRGAAQDDGEQIASTGRQGRGEEAAGEHPHHNVKLLECLLDGGEWPSGGAASGRSMAMAVAEELRCLGFQHRPRLRLGEELRHGGGA